MDCTGVRFRIVFRGSMLEIATFAFLSTVFLLISFSTDMNMAAQCRHVKFKMTSALFSEMGDTMAGASERGLPQNAADPNVAGKIKTSFCRFDFEQT